MLKLGSNFKDERGNSTEFERHIAYFISTLQLDNEWGLQS